MTGEWITEATVALARELWDQGMTTSAMGERLGCTKSAIVGLAHRKGFPPRPSPIWRNGALPGVQPRKPKYVRRPPEPLPSLAEPVPVVEEVAPAAIAEPAVAPPEAPAIGLPPPLCRDCQWPLGDPRKRAAFRYCAEPVHQAGGVYCGSHHALAYAGTARRVAA